MQLDSKFIWEDIQKIRQISPLIHNITNYVVMNPTANALLAIGASPVMAHAEEEVESIVGISSALVVNIGTLSSPWIRSMEKAIQKAKSRNIPVVLDPVGNGASELRTKTSSALLQTSPTIIRGNASEIQAFIVSETQTKGVDSTLSSDSVLDSARTISKKYGSVVCVSGEVDYVIWKDEIQELPFGTAMMTKVTGMGCTATALCAAFAAVNPSPFQATVHAMAVMGITGELALDKSAGPGSLQIHFLDCLYNLRENEIGKRLSQSYSHPKLST